MKVLRFLGANDNTIFPFIFSPHFSIGVEVNWSRIHEIDEVYIDLFGDNVGLLNTCCVLIIDSSKYDTNIYGVEFERGLDVGTLIRLEGYSLSPFNDSLLIVLLSVELNLHILNCLVCPIHQ